MYLYTQHYNSIQQLRKLIWHLPKFFGVHAEDAVATDPQHRILLEVSFEAVENGTCDFPFDTRLTNTAPQAGLRKEDIDNSNTSVFVGCFVKGWSSTDLSFA